VRQLLDEPDAQVVSAVSELLGERYPVFDAVAQAALRVRDVPPIDAAPVIDALSGLARLVVVGIDPFGLRVTTRSTHRGAANGFTGVRCVR
jgi:hypothetical protein